MAKAKYTLYKHVKLDRGWRYCRAAYHSNAKIKPNVVIVDGSEQTRREGSYYLYKNGQWIPAGVDAIEATKLRAKLVSADEYNRCHGIVPANETRGETKLPGLTLRDAADAYLDEVARGVRSKNKRESTLSLMSNTLRRFIGFCTGVRLLSEITSAHLDLYAAHVIAASPTHSSQTARNHYLRVNQFLRSRGVVLTKRNGDKDVPIGMSDAPKVSKRKKVITNTAEELEKFFAGCSSYRQWVTFQTFLRAGLREMELATTRLEDVVLDAKKPYIDVCVRKVDRFEFVPKWYAERQVNIDSELADALRELKKTSKRGLMFGTATGHLNLHLLRECKRIASRVGLTPARFRLHRFRANYATHCLRQGMDLETLREQMGHRDTESLRAYVEALKGEERAQKVEKVWSQNPLKIVPITLRKMA